MTGTPQPSGFDPRRRWFLSAAAAAAGVSLAPGVTLYGLGATTSAEARAPEQPASATVRWGLLVDVNQCREGCKACVEACSEENGLSGHGRPATDAQWIRKVEVRDPANGKTRSLPVMCQHCASPPCVDVCPTGASFRRADGIVLVDKHICIGCRYCMLACPYKARSFIHEALEGQKPHAPRGKGTVESCTFCVHRVDSGGTPACVEACAEAGGGAMIFGDLNDSESEISRQVTLHTTSRIRADLGLDVAVRYRNL
jgi:molybdopterin-containing oxidoreductase family iron-sulfur binding subunit